MDRLKGRKIAHHAAVMNASRVGIRPSFEQRGHLLSIGRVPADQENSSLLGDVSHGKIMR